MLARGARLERQAIFRLLESVRQETDAKRTELETRYAAIPTLAREQAEQVVIRILAMSPDALVEFFQDHRLRMTGKNPFSYIYGDPREARQKRDPEMAAAVARLNLALHECDHALLDLRISELFGGRLVWDESYAPGDDESERLDYVIALDVFAVMVSVAKADAFYRSLEGQDIRALDRENLFQLQQDWPSLVRLTREADYELESENLGTLGL